MLTKKDIEDQRELMQDDASCILDGIEEDDRLLNNIDQMIVERMQILIDKLDK